MKKLSAFLAATAGAALMATASPSVKLIHSETVNDTVVDATLPSGLAIAPNGDYLATFADQCDGGPGCKSYLIRSGDRGRTWSAPEKIWTPKSETEGISAGIFNLPDGSLMLEMLHVHHESSDHQKAVFYGNRDSVIELYTSSDNGRTFQLLQTLKKPDGALFATVCGVTRLANGDLVIGAYGYPQARKDPKAKYGSGWYRSTDGGKTWGDFEPIFRDEPKNGDTPLGFNENTFVVRPDGSIVAFARIDSRPVCNHYMAISKDQGRSWSDPVDTGRQCGDYPHIVKLDDGSGWLMVCGNRAARPIPDAVTFFHSADGVKFKDIGTAFYQPDNRHVPFKSATGGIQNIIHGPSKNQYYVIFYAHDPKLPGVNKLRIEGNMIEIVP